MKKHIFDTNNKNQTNFHRSARTLFVGGVGVGIPFPIGFGAGRVIPSMNESGGA